MSYLLLALIVLAPIATTVHAEPVPYCKRLQDLPEGVAGDYDIVGKSSDTGRAYSGTLQVSVGPNAYILNRTVQGHVLRGEAWREVCGPDKFQRMMVRFESGQKLMELSCHLVGDGDNFVRAACTTADDRGLEAWFQRHDSLAP